jgi:hypothetical protein
LWHFVLCACLTDLSPIEQIVFVRFSSITNNKGIEKDFFKIDVIYADKIVTLFC